MRRTGGGTFDPRAEVNVESAGEGENEVTQAVRAWGFSGDRPYVLIFVVHRSMIGASLVS